MPQRASFFVPGRVCLVGEHSDWSGGMRTTAPSLARGHAIVAGTREGLRVRAARRARRVARRRARPDRLALRRGR
jgi:galactokinase